MSRRNRRSRRWDSVAAWYAGWVGAQGSHHHRTIVHPTALALLEPGPSDRILDLGCGTGSFCRSLLAVGASYTGMDLSPRMIAWARKHQPRAARFHAGDATRIHESPLQGELGTFTAVTFLLSIQDIAPLEDALASAARALAPDGRLVVVMTHPCFRIPRQSGWSWDGRRKLASRRIDHYLTPLRIPLTPGDGSGRPGRGGRTESFHRPLSTYVQALGAAGFALEGMEEIPAPPHPTTRKKGCRDSGSRGRTTEGHGENEEIPLFLAIRAGRNPP
jgi:SAM-dependent methyltransferase